jgi:tight adherence protein C
MLLGYLVLIFCTVFLFTLWMLNFIKKKNDPAIRRLQNLQTDGEASAKSATSQKAKARGRSVNHLLQKMDRLFQKKGEKKNPFEQALTQAGFYHENSVRVFMALKLGLGLLFTLVYGTLTLLSDRPWNQVILFSMVMAIFGYMMPGVVLNFKIRKRQRMIASGLPDALDLLVISVEAGLGLNAALVRVGQDIRLRSVPLSEELLLVNQDMRTGLNREKALRRLAERNKVESLRILVGALVLADRLGTSIADTLRVQADSLRTRVRQRAEEQAAKAGVKMLLPLVLFILPALFIVLMGPGVIAISKSFSQIAGK